jgi:hypothetical protein
MRTATPPWPLRAARISDDPHKEARAKAADWKYEVDRLRKKTIMSSRGRIYGNVRDGRRSGRRGKVVKMNVVMSRRSDHRIWLVGLDCLFSNAYNTREQTTHFADLKLGYTKEHKLSEAVYSRQ